MQKEERILFPYIKHLETAAENNLSSPRPPFGSVGNPVRMMISEHDAAGVLLKKLREISFDYQPPEAACLSYRALFYGLEEIETDLHQHISVADFNRGG